MNKRYAFGIIILLLLVGIGTTLLIKNKKHPINRDTNKSISDRNIVPDSINVLNAIKDSIPPNWKTYKSKALGVTFKYPETWTRNGEESNAINRNGEVMSISVSFIDYTSDSNFYLTYHLAPFGAEVFKLAEEDYISSKNSKERDIKQINVSGNIGIETLTTMSADIKGNIYDPALKLIHIVFLDKQMTGAFNLNFRTPAPDSEKETAKFNQLLSTFKFINNTNLEN